jgi:hypothetical protein
MFHAIYNTFITDRLNLLHYSTTFSGSFFFQQRGIIHIWTTPVQVPKQQPRHFSGCLSEILGIAGSFLL